MISGTTTPLESFEKVAGYPSIFTVSVVRLEEDPEEPAGLKFKGMETGTINRAHAE